MRRFTTVCFCVLGVVTLGFSRERGAETTAKRQALVIVALAATEGYDQTCLKWAQQLSRDLVEKWGVSPEQLFVALPEGQAPSVAGSVRVDPSRNGVSDALKRIAANASAEADFFMFVFGSGSFDGREYKLNLKGPDLSGAEFKELLAAIRCRRQAVLWGTSSSGELVPLLSAKGRIVVTATRSGMERNDPRFPGAFLESLSGASTDTDKDQRVSWLEAYVAARADTEKSYKSEGHMATEHPLLDDSGDGEGHMAPAEENGDGLVAAITYFTVPASASALADPKLAELLKQRDQVELAIQELKTRRKDLTTADYDKQMEDLLLRMATVSAEIRKLEGSTRKPDRMP